MAPMNRVSSLLKCSNGVGKLFFGHKQVICIKRGNYKNADFLRGERPRELGQHADFRKCKGPSHLENAPSRL